MRDVSFTVSSTIVVRVEVTPGTARNLSAQDLAEMLRIAGPHLQQKAVLAGDVMDLEHFGDLRQRLRRRLLRAVFAGAHGDKGQQRAIGDVRIDRGDVFADDAPRFELAHALQDGRRRQAHGLGDVGLGRPRVFLKNLQNLRVNFVNRSVDRPYIVELYSLQ